VNLERLEFIPSTKIFLMKLISHYLLSLIYLADVSNLVLDNTGNDNNATLQTTSTTTTNNIDIDTAHGASGTST